MADGFTITMNGTLDSRLRLADEAAKVCGGQVVKAMASKLRSLTNDEISKAKINNSLNWHTKGVRMKEEWYGTSYVVHIMGYPTLRLFENGTQDRSYIAKKDMLIRYNDGAQDHYYKFKRGSLVYTGKILPLHFFKNARNRKSEIAEAGNRAWAREKKKLFTQQ